MNNIANQESPLNRAEQAILRPKQAAHYLNISTVTLWRYNDSDPTFPRKIRMSARCVGYKKVDLDAWLNSVGV